MARTDCPTWSCTEGKRFDASEAKLYSDLRVEHDAGLWQLKTCSWCKAVWYESTKFVDRNEDTKIYLVGWDDHGTRETFKTTTGPPRVKPGYLPVSDSTVRISGRGDGA